MGKMYFLISLHLFTWEAVCPDTLAQHALYTTYKRLY